MYNLTEIEITALNGILNSDYMDSQKAVNYPVWAWSANPFENKKVFSGACGTLHRKGYISSGGSGPTSTIAITKSGYRALLASNGNGAPRKPVQPVKALAARIVAKPAKAAVEAPKRAVIVTAKAPKRTARKPLVKLLAIGGSLIIDWRNGRSINADIVAETAKAWKLVAINDDGENGFECWFPKSAFLPIPNGHYEMADWFTPLNYTAKWLSYNSR